MIFPPRGDPSPLLHQSSNRRPERPKQKARCAPSLAAKLAGSVARFVTYLLVCPLGTDPRSPVIYTLLIAYPLSRNVTNGPTQKAVARRVSVSASYASALARAGSAAIGSGMFCAAARGRTLSTCETRLCLSQSRYDNNFR